MTIHIDNGSTSVGGGGTTNHAALTNLDFLSAGHTSFQADIGTDVTTKFLRGDQTWATPPAVGGLGTDTLIPYLGAISDTLLGAKNLQATILSCNALNAVVASATNVYATGFSGGIVKASAITCGTLQGVIISTGGSFSAIATGAVGQFLYQSGANVYAYADTKASLPSITTGIISGLLPITTDNTRYALGGAVQLSLNTATIWATTLSSTNTYSTYFSGGAIGIGAITCGTLQGVVISTGGSFSALATGAVGSFLAQSGANVYGWFNTSAVGGLGTDVVVPYVGAVSALVLGKNFSASGITCGTLQGVIIGTGGTFSAVATDTVGKFLAQSGANTYAWFNTAAQAGLGTDVVVPYASAVSDLILNKRFMATGITCGTLQGVVISTGGSFSAIATGAVGTFLSHTGANVYVWSATSAAGAQTTGILSANAPLTTSGLSHVATAAQTLSITTAIVAISAPLSTSAVFTTITAAQTLSITTGVLTCNPPLTTSAVVSLLSGAKTIGITTAVVSISAPLSTSAVFTTITAAQTLSITTGVLTCNPPLTTSAVVSLLSGAKTIGITTAIVSIVAPLSTSAVFTCLSAAQTLSINTATIWAVTLSASGTVYAGTLSGTTSRVSTANAVYSTITTSLIIPVSTNSALTVAGEVLVESRTTTGSAFKFFSDAQYVLPAYYTKSFCITTPAAAATYSVWRVPYTITIQKAYALTVAAGASSSLTGALYEGDGNGATLVTATTLVAIPANTNSALNVVNGGIDAGDWLCWVTTATAGTITQLAVTFDYTVND